MTHWEGEQCVASANLFFFSSTDGTDAGDYTLVLTTRSANHKFLLEGVYGRVAATVRQVEDLTLQKLKDAVAELGKGQAIQWPIEVIRKPPLHKGKPD